MKKLTLVFLTLLVACAPVTATGGRAALPQSQICVENRSGHHIAVYDMRSRSRLGTVIGFCDCVQLRGLPPGRRATLGFKAGPAPLMPAPPEYLAEYESWVVYLGSPPSLSPGTWTADLLSLRPGTCER